MDGLFHAKPYEQMDDLGGPPLFLETPIWYSMVLLVAFEEFFFTVVKLILWVCTTRSIQYTYSLKDPHTCNDVKLIVPLMLELLQVPILNRNSRFQTWCYHVLGQLCHVPVLCMFILLENVI